MEGTGTRFVDVDSTLRELSPHGTMMLPLQVNHDALSAFRLGHISCHWHEEIELSVVVRGTARYVLGKGACFLSAGQGVLINANVPHSIFPGGKESAELLTVIVHPAFIYGFKGSAIESQLMRPFLNAGSLSVIPLDAQEIALCQSVDQVETDRPFAWELECKRLLCSLFHALIVRHQQALSGGRAHTDAELQRLHLLLSTLNAHVDEPPSLERLAAMVGLSRESCCRFFRRMTGQTLSQYLEDCRVGKGLSLLTGGAMSVTEVALRCGFSNAGRFSAAFARRMHCTPRAYLRGLRESAKK